MVSVLLSMVVAAANPEHVAGQRSYQTRCAACHGADLRGGVDAPSLRGVGAADLDFWMVTGRMPAAVPWIEVGHRGQQMTAREIRSIEAYVTSVAPCVMLVAYSDGDHAPLTLIDAPLASTP